VGRTFGSRCLEPKWFQNFGILKEPRAKKPPYQRPVQTKGPTGIQDIRLE